MPNDFKAQKPFSDRSRDNQRGPRGRAGAPEGPARTSLHEEVIQLDSEIIRLIARRCKLVSKMRGGKAHASTPKAIKAEKEVRAAWEAGATKFSRDPHFVRQLFILLQDLEVQSLEEAKSLGAFKLAPARKPLALTLPGPTSGLSASLWAAMAAMTGAPITLQPVARGEALGNCVKALNQLGGKLAWLNADTLENQSQEPVTMAEKTVYAGEEFFNFCLLAFLALKDPGRVRFTGGGGLKSADLSALRHFVPSLGARLAHVVPGSNGLPATLECSGLLPHVVTLPQGLPGDALAALLVAARIWNVDITLHCGDLPAEAVSYALSMAAPVCRACGAELETEGASVHFKAGALKPSGVPLKPRLIMDTPLAAILLALPFFTGGSIALTGHWPDFLPDSALAVSMLRQFGVAISLEKDAIKSSCARALPYADIPPDGERLSPDLLPLFLAMSAGSAKKSPGGVPWPRLPEEVDPDLVEDFFRQLGLIEQDGRISAPEGLDKEAAAAMAYGWTSPGALWTMAFSLCAFIKPNLKLSNPVSATELLPGYWSFYNALPELETLKPPKEVIDAKPARRRIIAE